MSRYGWNTLPCEVLASIFHHVDSQRNDAYWEATTYLVSCQLVCENWSKAAQAALYSHVSLGSNMIRFIRTLEQEAPHVGVLVKKVTFLESFLSIRDPYGLIRSVCSHCPYIEEIYFSDHNVKHAVWAYLSAGIGEDDLCHVKIIDQDDSDKSDSYLYPFVALRFRNTLTKLELHIGHSLGNQPMNNLLAKLVKLFKSLQLLYIDTCDYVPFNDVDQVLTDCSQKVCRLRFNNLRFVDTHKPLNCITANTTIKGLSIAIARTNHLGLDYLASKLKGLNKLDIGYLYYPTKHDQEDKWCTALAQLCFNIKEFDISMSLPTAFGGQRQLESCAKLLVQNESIQQQKELHINFEDLSWDHMSDDGIYIYKHIIIKKQTNAARQFFISVKDIEGSFESKSSFIDCLTSYSPTLVKIRNIEPMTDIYTLFTVDSLKQDRLAPYFDMNCVGDIKQYFTRTCSKRNWRLLHNVLALTSKTAESAVSLSELVLCDVPPKDHPLDQGFTKVKHFYMVNSIVYYTVFPEISGILPTLQTFVIDTCSILMDQPHTVKIFLPSSSIHHFQLKINPFRDGTHRYPDEVEQCSLENLDLLKAISINGNCTLRIETHAQTLVFYKQTGRTLFSPVLVLTDDQTNRNGTKDNFLVWIKCKDFNEFSFIANGSTQLIKAIH